MMSSNSSRGVDLKAWIALSYSPMELRSKTKLTFNIKNNSGLHHQNIEILLYHISSNDFTSSIRVKVVERT